MLGALWSTQVFASDRWWSWSDTAEGACVVVLYVAVMGAHSVAGPVYMGYVLGAVSVLLAHRVLGGLAADAVVHRVPAWGMHLWAGLLLFTVLAGLACRVRRRCLGGLSGAGSALPRSLSV